jgi:hypothetical protein
VKPEDLVKAVLEWNIIKSHVKLGTYDIKTGFDTNTSKHYVIAYVVILCDTARECTKIANAFEYMFENFDTLKDISGFKLPRII